MRERSLRDLFHLIKKVLPDEQQPIIFHPETPVSEALSVMREKNFSQVPVVAGKEVLGVFSYRSFAEGIVKLPVSEQKPLALPVEEFLEDLKFAQITDDLAALIDEFDIKDAVLVGLSDRLQGIVTTLDALKYFYRVASPYVMLFEIELAIRELIRESVSNDALKVCIENSLKNHYEKSGLTLPTCLEEMNLNDYVMLISFKGAWEKFRPAFGGNRNLVYTKLKSLPELRNVIFHFKREITVDEYDSLRDVRDWLLKRIRRVEGSKKSDENA